MKKTPQLPRQIKKAVQQEIEKSSYNVTIFTIMSHHLLKCNNI